MAGRSSRSLPFPTRDPVTGGPLTVTRLENPESGIVIEGRFDLGWIGRLTREQLDFVGLLLKHRANVQRLAAEVGIAYNTARARMDDIVRAIGGDEPVPDRERDDAGAEEILERLARGELPYADALDALRRSRG